MLENPHEPREAAHPRTPTGFQNCSRCSACHQPLSVEPSASLQLLSGHRELEAGLVRPSGELGYQYNKQDTYPE